MGLVLDKEKFEKDVLTEEKVCDIGTLLEASGLTKSIAHVGTNFAEVMALQNYSCCITFFLQIAKHKFEAVDGFRNHSVVFLSQNLHFILTRCGSLLSGYVNIQCNILEHRKSLPSS
jgi:hypothetical protein